MIDWSSEVWFEGIGQWRDWPVMAICVEYPSWPLALGTSRFLVNILMYETMMSNIKGQMVMLFTRWNSYYNNLVLAGNDPFGDIVKL